MGLPGGLFEADLWRRWEKADVLAFGILGLSALLFIFVLFQRYPELGILWRAEDARIFRAPAETPAALQPENRRLTSKSIAPLDPVVTAPLQTPAEKKIQQFVTIRQSLPWAVQIAPTKTTVVQLNGVVLSRPLAPLMCGGEERLSYKEFLDEFRKICSLKPKRRSPEVPPWMFKKDQFEKTFKPDVEVKPDVE